MKYSILRSLLIGFILFVPHGAVLADEKWDELNLKVFEYYKTGNTQQAIIWTKKSLEYAKENLGEQHPNTLTSLNNLAVLYESQGRYELAGLLYIETLFLRKKVLGEHHPETLLLMRNLAALYVSQGRYALAEPLFIKVLSLHRKVLGEQHSSTLNSMGHLAALYVSQGRYELAEPLLVEVLSLHKKVLGEQHPETLTSLNNLAVLYESQGNYVLAEPLLVEVLSLHRKVLGEQHPETLSLMSNLAGLYKIQGRYELAKPLYVDALSLRQQVLGKQHPSTLSSMNGLAVLYESQGRYELAEPLNIETLSLRQQVLGKQHPDTLNSMNNLAGLYKSQGRHVLAEPLYVETLSLRQQVLGEQHPDTLNSMNNLAGLYKSQGRHVLAEPLYIETLSLRQQVLGKQHPDTLASLNNLAGLYKFQGRYELAEPLYIETLSLRQQVLGKQHPDTLASLNNLASLYVSQGRYELAEPLLVEALSFHQQVLGKQHPSTLTSQNNLAVFYSLINQHLKAEIIIDELFPAKQAYLQQVLWAAGEQTRQSYLQQQKHSNDFYFTVFSQNGSDANAQRALSLSLNQKGLLLQIATQIRAVSRSANNPELAEIANTLEENRKQIAQLILSGNEDQAALQILRDNVNQQQAELGQRVQQLGRSTQTVTPEQVIEALSSSSVFVDFIIYQSFPLIEGGLRRREQLLAIVTTNQKDKPIQLVSLGELAPIKQAIEQYRRILKQANMLTDDDKAIAKQLYAALWAPLQSKIKGKEYIYIAPDGILNLLPFASLIDEQDHYLIEKNKLIMLSSGRDLVLPALTGKVTMPVIVAAPLYDASQAGDYAGGTSQRAAVTTARAAKGLYFSPLPGALEEGEVLQAQLKENKQTFVYLKLEEATESRLSAIQSPRILHLATHGYYLEDLPESEKTGGNNRGLDAFEVIGDHNTPVKHISIGNPLLRSGLALVDANLAINAANDEQYGILTAEEVLDLELAGTQLVVLSACETGVGEIQIGEGVYGLRRSFQEAGAQSVLSTLWSISDEGTQHFMKQFYRRLLADTESQESLRETQLQFINSERWQHPFYWAPFVMVGK